MTPNVMIREDPLKSRKKKFFKKKTEKNASFYVYPNLTPFSGTVITCVMKPIVSQTIENSVKSDQTGIYD